MSEFGGHPPLRPAYRPTVYEPTHQPDQHAGYGVSGQPYSGHTPLPAELDPRQPRQWPVWQVVLITLACVLLAVGVAVLLRVYVFPPTTLQFPAGA